MSGQAGFIDELEADLGLSARLKVIEAVGGTKLYIPSPDGAKGSTLASVIGLEITLWLSGRYGGEYLQFPSRNGAIAERRAALLQAAVLDAGLTHPTRSANAIAREFGCTTRMVRKVRAQLRKDAAKPELPLFGWGGTGSP